ncbi:MAG TPA: hypothetical protein VLR89_01935 [Anaerolineaceae bacterium]|nr:hypothetical protein [Anaerolineaceae bacterium]
MKLKCLALFLCLVVLAGCNTQEGVKSSLSPLETQTEPAVTLKLEEPFSLNISTGAAEAISVNKSMSIRLVTVEDSRCPKDVTCVWAGMARVTVETSEPGKNPLTFELSLGADNEVEKTFAKWNEYYLVLKSVEPYPISTDNLDVNARTVTLVLTKTQP